MSDYNRYTVRATLELLYEDGEVAAREYVQEKVDPMRCLSGDFDEELASRAQALADLVKTFQYVATCRSVFGETLYLTDLNGRIAFRPAGQHQGDLVTSDSERGIFDQVQGWVAGLQSGAATSHILPMLHSLKLTPLQEINQ